MRRQMAFWALLFVLGISGCRSAPAPRPTLAASAPSFSISKAATPVAAGSARASSDPSTVQPAAFQESAPKAEASPPSALEEIAPEGELGFQDFVAAVVARHPTVQAMAAAWQAAAQRYPQAISLDDPMFMAMTAPASLNSATVEGAYALELRQKFPWFGKRGLRGDIANGETATASSELEDAQLKIALTAQIAYIEYYLSDRQLDLNTKSAEFMIEFREIAQARYRTNQVTQQDVLQAELELAELERRKLEIQRMRKVAMARMNTLLLREPSLPFPKPTLTVTSPNSDEDSSALLALAIQNRPDLAAQAHRVEVESSKLNLAYKQYYPDAEMFGRYDTFWQPASTQGDLRGQVGVLLNLPVYRGRLNAAVCEAQARLHREHAIYEQLSAEIHLEVQTALEQLKESEQTVSLYETRLMPTAEQYLTVARSNYEVGKATSLDLVQAQRQLLNAREKQVEATAALAQRIMELQRSLGGVDFTNSHPLSHKAPPDPTNEPATGQEPG